FARDFNMHAEVVVGLQKIQDHTSKMMHIDDHLADSGGPQARECNLQQRASVHFHQGLGTIIGKGPQARAQSGGQNHGFHLPSFSSPRCRTTTSTPFLPRKCSASCPAIYTERCFPPLQPKETIRLLNLRSWQLLPRASTSAL